MKYESSVKKLLQIFENENQTKIDSDNISQINLVRRDENYRKTVGIISIFKGFNIQTGTTNSTGFVNPLVKITNGSPLINPPIPIYPVLLDFVAENESVIIPNSILNKDANLLLVASSVSSAPVPDTEEDLRDINVTITPSDTNTPVNLSGTPVFIAPGVMQIPITSAETNVSGDNPNIIINVGNGVTNQLVQLNLSSNITVSSSLAPDVINNGVSPINNPASIPIVEDTGGLLGTSNNAPVPTFNFNEPQISVDNSPPPITINPVVE